MFILLSRLVRCGQIDLGTVNLNYRKYGGMPVGRDYGILFEVLKMYG
jgi:hypothetical protein